MSVCSSLVDVVEIVIPDQFVLISAPSPAWCRLYVRTYGNPENVIAPVRSIMQSLDPSVPLLEAFTAEEEIENSLWQERLINSLIGFFAIVALILAGVGVYGALAASVAQRTRELGIRVALGARANDMPIAVCRPIFWVLGSGLLSGLIIAALLTRVLRNQLYGVTPLDPFSFASPACSFCFVRGVLQLFLFGAQRNSILPVHSIKNEEHFRFQGQLAGVLGKPGSSPHWKATPKSLQMLRQVTCKVSRCGDRLGLADSPT